MILTRAHLLASLALPLGLAFAVVATSCGKEEVKSNPEEGAGSNAAGTIDGMWLLTDVSCLIGTMPDKVKAALSSIAADKNVYTFKGERGSFVGVDSKVGDTTCIVEHPVAISYPSSGKVKVTDENSKKTVKASPTGGSCDQTPESDDLQEYTFTVSGNTLELTTVADAKLGKTLCGSEGVAKFTNRKATDTDKPKVVTDTATPSPTPTPTPTPTATANVASFGDLFTVSPAPGAYTHGVIVKVSPKNQDAGVSFELKNSDGSWTFFSDTCIAGIESSNDCYVVNQTKTLTIRPIVNGDRGTPVDLAYTITPETKSVAINSASYAEQATECAVSESGGIKSLRGRIKVLNTTTLGATKVGYVFFEFNDVANVGQTVSISDSSYSGFDIKSNGDSAPFSSSTFYPGRNSSSPSDACTVKLTAFAVGGRAAGEIACNLTQSSFDTASPIGTTLTMPTTEWVCDRWLGGLF